VVFADGRKNPDTTVSDFQNGLGQIFLFIMDLKAIKPVNAHFFHFRSNRMFPISRQAIHVGAHQEIQ
jgi:hypothetical protein